MNSNDQSAAEGRVIMKPTQSRVKRAEQRLMAAEKKAAQAKAALRAANAAKRAKERKVERKLEARRQLLLGTLLQHKISTGEESESAVYARLERFLTRPGDRALFGFPERIANLPERIDTKPAALGKLIERLKWRHV